MMLTRTYSGETLSAVANHADVRPYVLGEGEITVNLGATDYALEGEQGGFFFHNLAPGLYEVHSLVLPSGRGRWSYHAMLEARDRLFSETPCLELVTKVPDANRAAYGLARLAGMRVQFRRGDTSYMTLGWIDAALKSVACRAEGVRFHDWLESVGAHSEHPDDPVHDHIVGASLLRARAGLPEVAVSLYNRWAAFSGYVPIMLTGSAPIEFDITDAAIRLHPNGEMERLSSQSAPSSAV